MNVGALLFIMEAFMILTDFLHILKLNGITGITDSLVHKASLYLIHLLPDPVKIYKIDHQQSIIKIHTKNYILRMSLCWNVASS